MKFNLIKLLISIAISGLITFGFSEINSSENKLVLILGTFTFLSVTLLLTQAISFQFSRTTTLVRVTSSIFFILGLFINFTFSFFNFSVPTYIVINGLTLLVLIFIIYSVCQAKH